MLATVAALAFIWWLIFVVAWVIFIFFTITIARSQRPQSGSSGAYWPASSRSSPSSSCC